MYKNKEFLKFVENSKINCFSKKTNLKFKWQPKRFFQNRNSSSGNKVKKKVVKILLPKFYYK